VWPVPFFDALAGAERILAAGAGGGFRDDVAPRSRVPFPH
jgi:hypothetical protein